MSSSPARVLGAVVGLALVLLVVGLALYARGRARTPLARPIEPVYDADGRTAGWTGQLELTDGTRLVARLVRLHPVRARQEFDAHALATCLQLPGGEPFRLDLRRLRAPGVVTESVLVDLGALRVDDERGPALATIAQAQRGAETALDPLRTLLAPPADPLRAGQAIEIVLWGREPEAAARLQGSFDDLTLALAPTTVRSADVSSTLARLDRAGAQAAPPKETR